MSESHEGDVWVDDYVTSAGHHVTGHWRKRSTGIGGGSGGVLVGDDEAQMPGTAERTSGTGEARGGGPSDGATGSRTKVEAGLQALRRRRAQATSAGASEPHAGAAFNYAAFVDRNEHHHERWCADLAASAPMDPQLRAALVERFGEDGGAREPAQASAAAGRCSSCGQFRGEGHTCPMPAGLPAGSYADLKGEERTAQMLSDLQSSVTAIVESGQLGRWLDAMASNGLNRWSFNNRLLSVLQVLRRNPDAELHLMGFRQWDKYNRAVRKGEKAVWILAPMTRKIREEDDAGVIRERTLVTGFKSVPVFNIDQTEGDPMPDSIVRHAEGEASAGTLEGLQERVRQAGYTYKVSVIDDYRDGKGTLGYTDPRTKRIVVDHRLSDAQKASTIAHELGHVHCGHVDADYSEYLQHRGRMETEAESVAYMVNRARGMSRSQADSFSPGYIAGWSRGKPEVITGAMERATKAFNKIMDGPWPNRSVKE